MSGWAWASTCRDASSSTDLEHCIAGDFNFTTSDGVIGPRSALGQAENRLKYHLGELTSEEKQQHVEIMVQALRDMLALLPLRVGPIWLGAPPIISPIPSAADSSRIAIVSERTWLKKVELSFMAPTLAVSKQKD